MNFSILVDMNLAPDWIPVLIAAGHTAVHWSSVGNIRALDPELIQWARDNDHIILTHDLDFGTILAQTHASRPSVVIIRADDPTPQRSVIRCWTLFDSTRPGSVSVWIVVQAGRLHHNPN